MEQDERGEEPKVYTPEQVSQGQTVLTTPLRRYVFFGGFALVVIFAIAIAFYGRR